MIVIYGGHNCGWCVRAKELAQKYELCYVYKEASEFKEEFKNKFPDAKTVPQILWHGKHIGGYDEFEKEIENTRSYGDGQV